MKWGLLLTPALRMVHVCVTLTNATSREIKMANN